MIEPTRPLLPLAGDRPLERRDAVRNRLALLDAATTLVERLGVDRVTMELVAAEAGVGKATVFRHFTTRQGLMAALLDHTEALWQAEVMGGPAPLGPGAPPMDRLLAFGESRMDTALVHADLIRAAGRAGTRSYAAYSFTATHVRYLLDELGVRGDIALLATALLAPLEAVILQQQVEIEQMSRARIVAGWADLAHRIVQGAPR